MGQEVIMISKEKNFTKERERSKRPEGRFWMQREKKRREERGKKSKKAALQGTG